MGVKDVIKFFKEKGGFNSYDQLADAAGVKRKRVEHAVTRESQLTASEEAAIAAAAGVPPIKGIAMFEKAYGGTLASIWANFRKPLNASNRGRRSIA